MQGDSVNGFLERFLGLADAGFGLIQGDVAFVLNALIVISVTLAGAMWALKGEAPIRVFDDGRRTYVEFPLDIATSEAPPLFLRDGADVALVNYRVAGNRYVIDRLFDVAELRLGGQRQTVVRISRERPRARGGPR